ncbi:hypothetical protein SLEP1_g34205 [Rubroshorea leprosula]|uniref:Glycosyltransferase n=1 Tax=Rubroshorea leprosula TaxID=152421 RepID=A0AAV5KJ72_9ROSI|nr:hypothetical protein SLEP1_g34205 [Rubroshorea leprosula]
MDKFHVVFISFPTIGNLVPTVEFARHLMDRDIRLSATVLVVEISGRPIINAYIKSCVATASKLNFLYLPTVDPPSPDRYQTSMGYLSLLFAAHKSHVKNAITSLMSADSASDSPRVGLFVDMFCTSMIDVANELSIPCYLFFASPASFLGFMLYFPTLDTKFATEFVDSDSGEMVPREPETRLSVPGFANPLPPQVLPPRLLKRKQDGYFWFLHHARRYKEVRGMVINTFRELETYALDSICTDDLPPVYPIGPILDLAGPAKWHPDRVEHGGIIKWLDDQPPLSVVLLCFGSSGCLSPAQLREIAVGLDRARVRFLWSIREQPKTELDLPGEFADPREVLPEGFLDRTAGVGLVCGWVPQAVILAHKAIGGFVSHCGWNSILESVWYGVPIATWPLYGEQQMNAFQLVKELGLAVEIRLDYREGSDLVSAEELEKALRRLTNGDDEIRRKVQEMKEMGRKALMENGSSYKSLGSLIQDLTNSSK